MIIQFSFHNKENKMSQFQIVLVATFAALGTFNVNDLRVVLIQLFFFPLRSYAVHCKSENAKMATSGSSDVLRSVQQRKRH